MMRLGESARSCSLRGVSTCLLLGAASSLYASWSCPLQPTNGCLGDVQGPDPLLTPAPSAVAVGAGSTIVLSRTGMVFALHYAAPGAKSVAVVAINATNMMEQWRTNVETDYDSASLAITEWKKGRVLVQTTVGQVFSFTTLNVTTGAIVPSPPGNPYSVNEPVQAITNFGGNANILMTGQKTGSVFDLEEQFGVLTLVRGVNCSIVTTSPDGEQVVCGCLPTGPLTANPTAICGYQGGSSLYTVPVASAQVPDDAVILQLVMCAGGDINTVVDVVSPSSSEHFLAAYDQLTGDNQWVLEYPWTAVGGAEVSRLGTTPSVESFLWVVAHADPASSISGWVATVDINTGMLLATLEMPTAKPAKEGIVSVVAKDGLTLYVHVLSASSASIAVIRYNSTNATLSLVGTLAPPANGTLDSSLFMALGPLDGMLTVTGYESSSTQPLLVWGQASPSPSSSTTSSTSPTSTSTGSSTCSPTASLSRGASESNSPTSPVTSTPRASPSVVSPTSTPGAAPPPQSGSGAVVGGVLGAFAAVAVAAGAFFYVNPNSREAASNMYISAVKKMNRFAGSGGGAESDSSSLLASGGGSGGGSGAGSTTSSAKGDGATARNPDFAPTRDSSAGVLSGISSGVSSAASTVGIWWSGSVVPTVRQVVGGGRAVDDAAEDGGPVRAVSPPGGSASTYSLMQDGVAVPDLSAAAPKRVAPSPASATTLFKPATRTPAAAPAATTLFKPAAPPPLASSTADIMGEDFGGGDSDLD